MSETGVRVADEHSRRRRREAAASASQLSSDSTRFFRTPTRRYLLERDLARGAATSVWLARDAQTNADVIVKKLEPATVRDPLMRRRVEFEARASDAISHPGIVPVIDRLFDDDAVGLVFPYVPGETLRERLSALGRLDARGSAKLALELADVVSAAHAAGIVHRDVKPANILLATDGQLRLLDFGIARFADTDDDETTPAAVELTGSGMAIGTMPYMAPEQLTGRRASPKTDVYALGVVLYESLSGSRPYAARSPSEQLALLQEAPPMIADAPEALVALALQAMNVRPEQRPTAGQFGRALRGWLDGRHDAESATAVVAAAAALPDIQRVQAASTPLPRDAAAQPLGALPRAARPIATVIAGVILLIAAGVALALIPGLLGGLNEGAAEPPPTVRSEPVVAPATRDPADENGGTGNRDGNAPNQGDNSEGDKDDDKGPDDPGPDQKEAPHAGNGAQGGGNGDVGGGNGGVGGGNGNEGHPPRGGD